MLTPSHLSKIAAFSATKHQASGPNMEMADKYLGELVDALTDSIALNLRLLPVEEYKQAKKGDEIECNTVGATIKKQQEYLAAIYSGRDR